MNTRLKWLVLLAALTAMMLTGCVERRLTINTEPQGALVTLNDEQIGISPVTVPFNWYGDYWVRAGKDGYETLDTHRDLKRPWHDWFPLDFFTQILYPGRIVDHYEWTFDLTPRQEITREQLLEQAETLKTRIE